jgi:hypothetical protein
MSQAPPKKPFFLPSASDAEQAEQVYQQIRKAIGGLTERRIYSLQFRDKGRVSVATVGNTYDGKTVIAIFESQGLYYVCTPDRGVMSSMPYMVGTDEVLGVEDFA